MADHRPSLVEPAEHLPAGTADRFGSRNACQRLELLVPRVDTEVGPERHQRVARAKNGGHPGNIRREREAGFPRRGSGIRAEVLRVWLDVGSGSRSRARYAHVADELRAAIAGGRLRPGARLPSERALAEEFGVSRATIVSAFHLLRGEGLIETRRGAGSWVYRRP